MTEEQINKFVILDKWKKQTQKVHKAVTTELFDLIGPSSPNYTNTHMECDAIISKAKERVREAFEQAIEEINNLIKEI